ncbi:hypothetical protein JD969_03925 [Planctomycetota bacterium]|nr:hypothetical protein JD969_03925 [Planctomycetota bacterium]
MLARYQSRILTLVAASIAATCMLIATPRLIPLNASTGITFTDAAVGPLNAIIITALFLLPALILSIFIAAFNTYLSATFISAFAVLALASIGGSPIGFIYRSDLPHEYTSLIIESFIWTALLFANLYTIQITRTPIQAKLPRNLVTPSPDDSNLFGNLSTNTILAAFIVAGLGGFLCNLLIQSTATSQSLCSLILAFFIATLFTRFIFPSANPVILLFSPMIAAIVGYTLVLINTGSYSSTSKILSAIYSHQFPPLAFPLPIFFISAGTIGVILGITAAKGFENMTIESATHQSETAE